jgi:hypothetical protein
MVSSSSSILIASSSSDTSLSEDDPSILMLVLPSELDTTLSTPLLVDHSEFANPGESGTELLCLLGIFTPLPPITGDESGDDCSAKVE